MKLMKFGKALLMSALSAGLMLGVTSCVRGYTVGFLYVTGTQTADTTSNGIISGFRIDHNSGKLTAIHGMPVSSGGANPVRAVLISGSRFVYVLNRGANSNGGSTCTVDDPCLNSNISQFAVGGNGSLTFVNSYTTQGINPFRLVADGSGTHLYVLEESAPTSSSSGVVPASVACPAVLGSGVTSCGDITAFAVDSNTGRLTLVTNSAATTSLGETLSYFPVPANPVDFTMASSYLLTLSDTPATTGGTGESVFPYSYTSSTGQLTVNPVDALSDVKEATAIISAGSYVYVLDNEPPSGNTDTAVYSQILPYSVGTSGSLSAVSSGAIAGAEGLANPVRLTLESKGKWFYVANAGCTGDVYDAKGKLVYTCPSTSANGVAAYILNSPYHPELVSNITVNSGTGSGPQCLVEDPSDQYFYEANANDATVTAHSFDANRGTLYPLQQTHNVPSSYTLNGPATWCLVDGRTN